MRFKAGNELHSYDSKVKGERVHIRLFQRIRTNQKVGDFSLDIETYLEHDSEYQRRQHLFNSDIGYLKSKWEPCPVVDGHLDAIHKSVTHALKEAGRFRPTFADVVQSRREERTKLTAGR